MAQKIKRALLAYEPYKNKDSKYLTATLHKNNYTDSFRQDNRRSNSKQTDDELRPRCEELGGGKPGLVLRVRRVVLSQMFPNNYIIGETINGIP